MTNASSGAPRCAPARGLLAGPRARWALALPAALLLAACQQPMPPAEMPPPPEPAYAPMPPPEPPPAPAVPQAEQLTVARACAGDIERFCAGVPPRQGFIKDCMRSHVSELSAPCFDAVMGAIAAEHPP